MSNLVGGGKGNQSFVCLWFDMCVLAGF
uniref:Uncharacterized protein n=1 Tax=Arundo donax TaxID=35708 RepID=A0A0A9HBX1_ARUDO